MKTIKSLIIMTIFLVSINYAQKIMPDKVPASVKQTYMKTFPKATESAWRMDNDNYQVMFGMNGVKHAAKFDKNGVWVDKEEKMNIMDLPREVTSSIAKNFPGFKVYEAEKAEANGKGMLYNVGLEKGKEFMEVHLSPAGDVLGKMAKTKQTEWGKDSD
jgi:hypothetical protein